MGITIYLGAYFGKHLDQKYLTEKAWFTISCVFLALLISLYSVVQQLNRINKESFKSIKNYDDTFFLGKWCTPSDDKKKYNLTIRTSKSSTFFTH